MVTANPDSGYLLDYWLLNEENAGSDNPINVTMDDDHTLQPVFHEGTIYHWLTVDAYWSSTELHPNVYIDSNWAGTAPLYVQVTEGWHSIEVDEGTYDEYDYPYLFCYFTGYVYDNPTSIAVNSDTWTTAWYVPYDK